jgi:hypothetical protein
VRIGNIVEGQPGAGSSELGAGGRWPVARGSFLLWLPTGKPALGGLLFLFHSISSEYQVRAGLLPDFRRYFGVEVLVYQRLLL